MNGGTNKLSYIQSFNNTCTEMKGYIFDEMTCFFRWGREKYSKGREVGARGREAGVKWEGSGGKGGGKRGLGTPLSTPTSKEGYHMPVIIGFCYRPPLSSLIPMLKPRVTILPKIFFLAASKIGSQIFYLVSWNTISDEICTLLAHIGLLVEICQ